MRKILLLLAVVVCAHASDSRAMAAEKSDAEMERVNPEEKIPSPMVFRPVKMKADVPPWMVDNVSALHFYISGEKEGKVLLAITAADVSLFNVSVEISANGRVVIPYREILQQLHHHQMAVVEIPVTLGRRDLAEAEITRFAAITK